MNFGIKKFLCNNTSKFLESIKNLTSFSGRNIKNNLIFTFVFTIAIFLPDQVIGCIYGMPIGIEILFFLGVVLFGFLFSLTNKFVLYVFLALIFIMQIIQLNNIVYFGSPITPSVIMNIVREKRDVFDLSYLNQTWPVFILLFLSIGAIIYSFSNKYNKDKMIKVKFIWILIFYLASHKPYRAFSRTKGVWYFQPSITRPTLKNSISTFSFFVFQYYPLKYETQKIQYKPYKIEEVSSRVKNILLIFGESLYSEHMPMYGYDRNTFPLLVQRMNREKNWRQYSSISASIATASSTTLFFNVIREPANGDKTFNLFRLAKEHGFKTYYFSNQESRLVMDLEAKYIDEIVTHDNRPLFFTTFKDEGLLKLIKEVDFSKGKNFIVLHMRSPHLPYENRYKGREGEFEKFKPADKNSDRMTYMTNTYDNALLYTDYVIDHIITVFQKLTKGIDSNIYITADHGQLFNYNGKWGHNNLVMEQGKVPFLTTNILNSPNASLLSYYEIGKMIANDLGWNLLNPNEDNDTFYLHGINIDFPYSFIEYKINDGNVLEEIREGHTSELK